MILIRLLRVMWKMLSRHPLPVWFLLGLVLAYASSALATSAAEPAQQPSMPAFQHDVPPSTPDREPHCISETCKRRVASEPVPSFTATPVSVSPPATTCIIAPLPAWPDTASACPPLPASPWLLLKLRLGQAP